MRSFSFLNIFITLKVLEKNVNILSWTLTSCVMTGIIFYSQLSWKVWFCSINLCKSIPDCCWNFMCVCMLWLIPLGECLAWSKILHCTVGMVVLCLPWWKTSLLTTLYRRWSTLQTLHSARCFYIRLAMLKKYCKIAYYILFQFC